MQNIDLDTKNVISKYILSMTEGDTIKIIDIMKATTYCRSEIWYKLRNFVRSGFLSKPTSNSYCRTNLTLEQFVENGGTTEECKKAIRLRKLPKPSQKIYNYIVNLKPGLLIHTNEIARKFGMNTKTTWRVFQYLSSDGYIRKRTSGGYGYFRNHVVELKNSKKGDVQHIIMEKPKGEPITNNEELMVFSSASLMTILKNANNWKIENPSKSEGEDSITLTTTAFINLIRKVSEWRGNL